MRHVLKIIYVKLAMNVKQFKHYHNKYNLANVGYQSKGISASHDYVTSPGNHGKNDLPNSPKDTCQAGSCGHKLDGYYNEHILAKASYQEKGINAIFPDNHDEQEPCNRPKDTCQVGIRSSGHKHDSYHNKYNLQMFGEKHLCIA